MATFKIGDLFVTLPIYGGGCYGHSPQEPLEIPKANPQDLEELREALEDALEEVIEEQKGRQKAPPKPKKE
jgi:hypothetical protein